MSVAELSAAVTIKLLRSNAAQSVDMLHWAYIKTNWKGRFVPLRSRVKSI